jgi:hypothetical protein
MIESVTEYQRRVRNLNFKLGSSYMTSATLRGKSKGHCPGACFVIDQNFDPLTPVRCKISS